MGNKALPFCKTNKGGEKKLTLKQLTFRPTGVADVDKFFNKCKDLIGTFNAF